MTRVTWRGHTFDARTRDMLVELDRLAGPLVPIRPTQGSYSTGVEASAGTHSGGGACDLSAKDLTPGQIKVVVFLARRIGFAAWHRSPSEGPWPAHIHLIARGCPDLAPGARRQVEAYDKGLSGLASGRRDKHRWLKAPVTTWEEYDRG